MPEAAPELIGISHDDFYSKHIGKTADGQQFFLTNPFIPAIGENAGREFIALYLFTTDGHLIEAKIDDLGTRQHLDDEAARALIEKRLAELGEISFGDIEVAPFRLERFGTEFGLILNEPEDADEDWTVTAEPGNYMAFYPPWDGDYDT